MREIIHQSIALYHGHVGGGREYKHTHHHHGLPIYHEGHVFYHSSCSGVHSTLQQTAHYPVAIPREQDELINTTAYISPNYQAGLPLQVRGISVSVLASYPDHVGRGKVAWVRDYLKPTLVWIAFSTVHVILELILYMLDEIWE